MKKRKLNILENVNETQKQFKRDVNSKINNNFKLLKKIKINLNFKKIISNVEQIKLNIVKTTSNNEKIFVEMKKIDLCTKFKILVERNRNNFIIILTSNIKNNQSILNSIENRSQTQMLSQSSTRVLNSIQNQNQIIIVDVLISSIENFVFFFDSQHFFYLFKNENMIVKKLNM